jgi:orotidine-5'-phosphate decarboxylase
MSAGRYLDLLAARTATVQSCLCLGLDPDPGSFPVGFSRDLGGLERFCRLVLEAALPYAAAVKANLAFFEAHGSAGLAALERLRADVPPAVPFIADAKRGDIGSTSSRIATAVFDALGADAVTANPYLGRDALAPLLERDDRFTYVLCRTSNRGAGELQDLELGDGEPIYLHVARRVAAWTEAGATAGLVVGATAPAELARIRRAAPRLPFLVPGAGAQGGDVEPVMQHGPVVEGSAAESRGGALLVNVSRAIAGAASTAQHGDAGEAISSAAQDWSRRLRC